MLKKALSTLALGLLTTLPLFSDINTTKLFQNLPEDDSSKQGIVIPIPDEELQQSWKLAFQEAVPNGPWIIEWTPKDEDVTNWTKLIQIQFLPAKQFGGTTISAEDFSKSFVSLIKEEFPDIVAKVTPQGANGTIIDWSLPKASGTEPPQHELARIISTPQGIYRIAFTVKVPAMDNTLKETWTKRLANTSAVPAAQ